MGDHEARYIHLKEIFVEFIKRRPKSVLELVLKNDAGVVCKSDRFKEHDITIHWNLDIYVKTHTCATLTIQRALSKISVARIEIEFKSNEFGDYRAVGLQDSSHHVSVNFVCGRSKSLADVAHVVGPQARTDLASTAPRFLKLPQVAVFSPLTPKLGYNAQWPATSIHRLNNDILLGVFNFYRLGNQYHWNRRLLWCKLSHVCQRWRHVIYEFAFHLGMQIRCTNGSPIVDTLDHLPPLPLFIEYGHRKSSRIGIINLTEQDESGIFHTLRLHGRVCHIELDLPPSVLHKVVALMDQNFPILEHLSLSFAVTCQNNLPFTLPKAFLAPNLHHLTLPSIDPVRRLRVLTSTISLVTLKLSIIQTSGYFRPGLLVARFQSLPLLEELCLEFSIPIPHPSAETELLGEHRAPVTLPSLKYFQFKGVSAYLESLVAQIRVPLLEWLSIALFNQISLALLHLSPLINAFTEGLKVSVASVTFGRKDVSVAAVSGTTYREVLRLSVICKPLDWQIDCAAQICQAIIPALSYVHQLTFYCGDDYSQDIQTELQNSAIDSTTWNDLLRSFIGVKTLYINETLLEELSGALQVEVGSDPGFLPNLRKIGASRNVFTSFIDTRQVVGRPVQFKW